MADIGDRFRMAAEHFADRFVGVAFLLRAIEEQQNAGACQFAGSLLAGAHQAFELLSMFG